MLVSKVFLDGFIYPISISNQDRITLLNYTVKPMFHLLWQE